MPPPGAVANISARSDAAVARAEPGPAPGSLTALLDLLPEPTLLVTANGRVLAANRALAVRIGRPAPSLVGGTLAEAVTEGSAEVDALLRRCARSSTLLPGSLSFHTAGGAVASFRCDGAAWRRSHPGAGAWILLRLSDKDAAAGQFVLLRDRVEQLSREISRRRQLERELRDKTARLEEEDRRKDEFLSMLAHELRNPLAPLRSGIHVLATRHDQLDGVGRIAAMMRRQVDHMVRLVDDLLDIARVQRGTLRLRVGEMPVREAVEQAVEMMRPSAEARQLALSVETAPLDLQVRGDHTRLVQVFSNLLANAIKFTPPGGKITVVLQEEAQKARVEVRDTGIGMDPELLPRVFDMFVQGDSSLERAQAGLGIGLTVARAVVDLHGGDISAHSSGREMGSVFVVRLPTASAVSAA
jgi:signal transduction histidine kinase